MRRWFSLTLMLFVVGAVPAWTDTKEKPVAAKQFLQMQDILAWKSIRGATLSDDGKWFGYTLSPQEGNGEVILRQTQGTKEHKYPIGEHRGFGGGRLQFSDDSQWAIFTINPEARQGGRTEGESRRPRGPGRGPGQPRGTAPAAAAAAPAAPRAKTALVELATGKKTEFENMRRADFAGKKQVWLALHKNAGEAQTNATDKWSGTDLLLRDLRSGNELCLGNVSEFAFDKKGERLAMLVDAQGQAGNSLQLFTLATGTLQTLDHGKASFKSLNWAEEGNALACLKATKKEGASEPQFQVVGVTFAAGKSTKTVVDPLQIKDFPQGKEISGNRAPSWTDDRSGLLFGLADVKAKPAAKPEKKLEAKPESPKDEALTGYQPDRTAQPRGATTAPAGNADKPDLVLWHWADPRLQSQQQVQANTDKNFSYLSTYRIKEKKVVPLADQQLRTVTVAPKHRWGLGSDNRPYELAGSLDGRRFQDLYSIDMQTGQRKLILKRNRWSFGVSPKGTHLLYYDDGHFYTCDLSNGKTYNITLGAPVCFVDDEDDHNVAKPPRFPLGWSADGASVLLSDGWDWYRVPAEGGTAVNLTVDGKKEGIRYQRAYQLDPEAKGIDLSKPVYLSVYGEWTKKGGIARLDAGKPGAKRLRWDEAGYGGLLKAKDAEIYLFTRETGNHYPDCHVAGQNLSQSKQLTNANPQQEKFAWSSGVVLVNYTNARGQKLQGALYLPAGYDKGKRYPTIVYIYEKLSQGAYRYTAPAARGFNKSVYTSNGYAVLMPDITYQLNDPGRSATDCVIPALEAAIATGVVDRERVGLHGHSWGGYQTAFLITQSHAFKAAVAGAPLTNMVSMYSSIYWNTGSANQAIFESSQGRFTKGYWDDIDAYTRNSPVWFAKNVNTPLLLLHNDRDGAVDWNQGIEYFNTLRRLGKPVVMLQYKGENHGLTKPANLKDYHRRMQEFFDHYLKDQPAPAWWKEGVPHMQMEEHLKERAEAKE